MRLETNKKSDVYTKVLETSKTYGVLFMLYCFTAPLVAVPCVITLNSLWNYCNTHDIKHVNICSKWLQFWCVLGSIFTACEALLLMLWIITITTS